MKANLISMESQRLLSKENPTLGPHEAFKSIFANIQQTFLDKIRCHCRAWWRGESSSLADDNRADA